MMATACFRSTVCSQSLTSNNDNENFDTNPIAATASPRSTYGELTAPTLARWETHIRRLEWWRS